MLAHCYISYCTPGPSPYAYKRKAQGTRTRRLAARGGQDGACRPLAPSHADACNPLLQAHPTWARDKHEGRGFPLYACLPLVSPFTLRLAPTHLGWGTRRQFTRRSGTPGSKRRQGDIEIAYVSTKEQLADIFTKPLDEKTFTKLRNELNILDSRNFD